jgi:nicotinate-nucleotide adenylyltransferase
MTGSDRIGLFGGTFNPVHLGHRAIAESFLRSRLFQELWILVTPDPPHKADKPDALAPFADRLAMTKLAFADLDRVRVSELEASLDRPHYTLRTIQAIRQNHPAFRLFYCMGEDSLQSFPTWYKPKQILEEVTLVVAGRPVESDREEMNLSEDASSASGTSGSLDSQETQYESDIRKMMLEKTVFVDHDSVDISSSRIRKQLAQGRIGDVEQVLHPEVLFYIQEHALYRDETI